MQSMKRNRGVLRAWLLAAALAALPLTTHAMSIRPEQIFRRDDTCGGDASLAKCTQSGLPDNFCCDAKGSECVVLAGATTVICCPGGKANCAVIAPIVCDLKLQDAETYPGAQVKTTVLAGSLPKCGVNCCPYGYSCVDDNCVMDADQSKKPLGASPSKTPVSSSVPSPTSKPAASSTASGSPETTSSAAPSSAQPEEPAAGNGASAAIIGGAVAGGLMVILMIVAAVIVCRRRSKRQEKQSNVRAPSAMSMRSARNRDTKSFFGCIGKPSTGPPFHISAPIGNVQRSDFNGKGTPSIGSTASVSFYRPSQEAAVRHDYWNSDGLGVPADGQSPHWARHPSAMPPPIRPIRGMNHSGRSSARSSVGSTGSIGHFSASAQHAPRQPSPESIQVRLDAQQYAAATYGRPAGLDGDKGGPGRHRLAPPLPPSPHLAPPSAYDDRRDTTWTDIRDYASGPQN